MKVNSDTTLVGKISKNKEHDDSNINVTNKQASVSKPMDDLEDKDEAPDEGPIFELNVENELCDDQNPTQNIDLVNKPDAGQSDKLKCDNEDSINTQSRLKVADKYDKDLSVTPDTHNRKYESQIGIKNNTFHVPAQKTEIWNHDNGGKGKIDKNVQIPYKEHNQKCTIVLITEKSGGVFSRW